MGFLGVVSTIFTVFELCKDNNKHLTYSDELIAKEQGYELDKGNNKYVEMQSKYMIGDLILVKNHSIIPNTFRCRIEKKRYNCISNKFLYIVRYYGREYILLEEDIKLFR